jgi:hypothetical protein
MTMSSLDQPLHDAAELSRFNRKNLRRTALDRRVGRHDLSGANAGPARRGLRLGRRRPGCLFPLRRLGGKGAPDFSTPGLTAEKDGLLIRNPNKPCGYAAARFTGFDRLDLKTYERKGFYAAGW